MSPGTASVRSWKYARHALPMTALLACSSAPCIYLPCPLPQAAEISVTAANAPTGIPGLTMAVTGAVLSTGPCVQGPVNTCHVMGGTGNYQVTLTAPNYVGAQVIFTVTGSDAGCNTCGHIDMQQIKVTLQPAG